MVEWERKRKITMGAFEDYDFYTLTIQKLEWKGGWLSEKSNPISQRTSQQHITQFALYIGTGIVNAIKWNIHFPLWYMQQQP